MALLRMLVVVTLSSGGAMWFADHVRWRRRLDERLGIEDEADLNTGWGVAPR